MQDLISFKTQRNITTCLMLRPTVGNAENPDLLAVSSACILSAINNMLACVSGTLSVNGLPGKHEKLSGPPATTHKGYVPWNTAVLWKLGDGGRQADTRGSLASQVSLVGKFRPVI